MHEYTITSSSLLPLHPFMQQRTPSDLQSRASASSCGTVHRPCSNGRTRSTRSRGSVASNRLRVGNENVPSSRESSYASLPTTPTTIRTRSQMRTPGHIPRVCSWPSRVQGAPSFLSDAGPLEDIDLNSLHQPADLDLNQDHGLSFDINGKESPSTARHHSSTSQEAGPARKFFETTNHPFSNGKPFRKWVGSLRQQQHIQRRSLTARKERWTLDDLDDDGNPAKTNTPKRAGRIEHQKSSSWSPYGFVAAVKSATANLAPSHAGPRSRVTRRSYILRSDRSSKLSDSQHELPSAEGQRRISANHHAAYDRAVRRRQLLEELVSSEESYVADLKVLLHVYVFILNSAPKVAQATQPDVSRNVGEMLCLHEEILFEIKPLILGSADRPADSLGTYRRFKHSRWHSIEALEGVMGEKATNAIRRSLDVPWLGRSKHQNVISSPQEAADIARIFERLLPRFFVYEEYGAKYESMLQNMASLSKTMPTWSAYERGIESLVNSLIPRSGEAMGSKKGLTLADLLIKPIQRVCRYPLLFAELYKYTLTIDDPEAKAQVEKIYSRLRETANGINQATNDLQTQILIQRSWRLQDLLIFSDTFPAPFPLRQLGYASLCGALYVAYQSKDEVLGNYMFCALFGSHLLLAIPRSGKIAFEIVAIISLHDVQMDKADNGKGLQCHTAPFSWKLIFDFDQQLYELMLCACTAREEQQWKADLLDHAAKQTEHGVLGSSPYNFPCSDNAVLCLDIEPLGPVFGLPGTLMRRQSIQRAFTVNSRKNTSQVIIKNTFSNKENGDSPIRSGTLSRSKSFMSTNRMPLLAPRRGDRQRIVQKMSEVWTKDRLPYPGTISHRGGHLIRASANSVLRKLSMASTNTTVSVVVSMKQRIVTYGSIAESNPFVGNAAGLRANQTDGASSPCNEVDLPFPEPYQTTFEHHEPLTVSEPTLSTPNDEHMTYVTDLRIDSMDSNPSGGKDRELSETSTVVATRTSTDWEPVKGRSHTRKKLLKAFSTDGIRSWFHHKGLA